VTDLSVTPMAKPAHIVHRIESLHNSWAHDIPEGIAWTEATSRDYWSAVVERFCDGDSIQVHSFDHRVQFTVLILGVSTAADPIYLHIAFLPIYPPDLQLPEAPPQVPPRYQVRQAPGLSTFNVVDVQTGRPVHETPKDRHAAMELASEMERALAATSAHQCCSSAISWRARTSIVIVPTMRPGSLLGCQAGIGLGPTESEVRGSVPKFSSEPSRAISRLGLSMMGASRRACMPPVGTRLIIIVGC
jgi:hypothetical protein